MQFDRHKESNYIFNGDNEVDSNCQYTGNYDNQYDRTHGGDYYGVEYGGDNGGDHDGESDGDNGKPSNNERSLFETSQVDILFT